MPQLTTLIPSFAAPVTDRVWLVGAHGGAGCTTIRHSDPERFADAGRALPVSQDPSMPSRIILCAMGTGNKLDPTSFTVTDLSKTAGDGLARVMRKELKKRGITLLKVVYSTELPHISLFQPEPEPGSTRRSTPGSVPFVPPVAGLIAASQVVKDLLAK